ncbi:metallophosphoesterase [Salinarchaeum laminariae]|uniref:metallophosphoesterase n=1 Tax=Salinarchaeum laminariae TaxID=869888 RepID=UPI0020BD4A5E|nr:metallophosphoesterase [Salinarchaeum laminariae]
MQGSPPTFGSTVDHLRLDADDYEDCYVVGDVHGCIDRLEALIGRLDPAPTDLLVFVGDLVRKGPDSAAVLEWVRDRPNAYSVLGNNEAKVLDGATTQPPISASDRSYLRDLPDVITFDDAIVAHGGIDPRTPLDEQDAGTLTEIRSVPAGAGYDGPFWFEQYDGPHRVYFGHTVLEAPYVTEHAVGLDTGCVYGGRLTAYRHGDGEVTSVDGRFEEWNRPADQIVSPSSEHA